MTATYAELMREWHAIARHVEDIPDDDLRRAAYARMDAILSECAEVERADDADARDLAETIAGLRAGL